MRYYRIFSPSRTRNLPSPHSFLLREGAGGGNLPEGNPSRPGSAGPPKRGRQVRPFRNTKKEPRLNVPLGRRGRSPLKKLYFILKIEIPLPRQRGPLFQKSIGAGGGRGWGDFPALFLQRGTSPPLYPPARGKVPLQPLYEAGLRPPRTPQGRSALACCKGVLKGERQLPL